VFFLGNVWKVILERILEKLYHRKSISVISRNKNVFFLTRGFATGGEKKPKKEKKPVEPVPDLVTVPWLQEQLRIGKIKVLDASWGLNGNFYDDYLKKRIPGALYFDIDKIADTSKDLPHMLPKPIPYEKAMEELGLTHKDHVIIYDRSGQYIASARVWWTLKTYGHDRVSILTGGLGTWEKEKGQIESGQAPYTRPKGRYKSKF